MLTVGSVVIRVDDLAAQVRLWAAALDYVVREPMAPDFALLRPREVPWDRRPADADYVIMEDPEGNRFCVVDASR